MNGSASIPFSNIFFSIAIVQNRQVSKYVENLGE